MTRCNRYGWAFGLAACLSLGGCGSDDVPAKQLADAEASIRAASEVGAENTPDAALQLKMARDRLARAKMLSADGENEDARVLLEEAELDAELALLLARKEDAQIRAKNAEQRTSGSAKEDDSDKTMKPRPAPSQTHDPNPGSTLNPTQMSE